MHKKTLLPILVVVAGTSIANEKTPSKNSVADRAKLFSIQQSLQPQPQQPREKKVTSAAPQILALQQAKQPKVSAAYIAKPRGSKTESMESAVSFEQTKRSVINNQTLDAQRHSQLTVAQSSLAETEQN